MMLRKVNYKVLILFSLIGFHSLNALACSCGLTSIGDNYKSADIIFYGKFIGSGPSKDAFALDGKQLELQQFEVIQSFKGFDKTAALHQLSLVKGKSSCAYYFTAGAYYLVYANADISRQGFSASMCSRTKEIRNNQFIVATQPDPDAGKDEQRELLRLGSNKKDLSDVVAIGNQFEARLREKEAEKIDLQKQLKKKSSMTIILSTSVLILLIYIIFGWFKKRGG